MARKLNLYDDNTLYGFERCYICISKRVQGLFDVKLSNTSPSISEYVLINLYKEIYDYDK